MTNKHTIRMLLADLENGQCTWCGPTQIHKEKGKYKCVNDIAPKKAAAPGKTTREKSFTTKVDRLQRTYNLSFLDYLYLLDAANYACEICVQPFTKESPPHIDHNHACCPDKTSCGQCIRGLLCRMCNAGIGYFKDNAQALVRASDYLTGT